MDNRRFISEDADNTAKAISNFINNFGADLAGCAYAMSKDHRYLVEKTFDMVLYYLIQLNENFLNNWYDERNEFACKAANKIITHLREEGLLDDMYYNSRVEELRECRMNRVGLAD